MSKKRTASGKIPLLSVPIICQRLRKQYGPVRLSKPLPPLDELIATILSQNTSDRNSDAAFDELRRRFCSWDAVRRAPLKRLVQAIRRGGLAQQKAPRIKAILQRIYKERGELSLDFLCDLSTDEAMRYLRRFPGVGPKTASCVLLFACGMPVLPVDTHVFRVSRRLGLIDARTNVERAHEALAKRTPSGLVLEFHIQLIRHGRTMCVARNPRCTECVLRDGCPEGQRRQSP